MDIHPDPGWESTTNCKTVTMNPLYSKPNLSANRPLIEYSSWQLFSLRRKSVLPNNVYNHLKGCDILKSRGVRSGKLLKRKIGNIGTSIPLNSFSVLNSSSPTLHCNEPNNYQDSAQPIPVRVTVHPQNRSFVMGKHVRNSANLRNINIGKPPSNRISRIRMATWNAQSINKKSASICDLIISKRIDILAITET